MKKQIILTLILIFFFLSGALFAGNFVSIKTSASSPSVEKITHQSADTVSMKNKSEMKMDHGMKKAGTTRSASHASKLIRTGVIDVESLDKNHDGKLYEDVMDFNVISDKPGTCPLCGMKLHEMTIQQVKENLKKHGFKYK